MAAKLLCVCATVMGAALGACLPVSSDDKAKEQASEETSTAPVADAPLEIVISQFPRGYQGKWASSAAACADDPETSKDMISLQGRLVKLHNAIGTMTAGKRMTSRTLEGEFEFVSEGEKSNKPIAFEMSEDMKRLTRTDKDDGQSYRYVQCPKLMAG